MEGSLFSALAHRLGSLSGEVYPLHVGDTWLEPAVGCRMEDLRVADHPGMHRYSSPHGHGPLIERIVDRQVERTGAPTTADNVLVAAGATGALGATIGATMNPEDEVLILAPYCRSSPASSSRSGPYRWWFRISAWSTGHTRSPAFSIGTAPSAPRRCISAPRTTPPARSFLPPRSRRIADWSARNDLWLIADEVYEDYIYEGEHRYARGCAPERTFSVHSFSKAYGMAGNRCGYVVGPAAAMGAVRKVSTHTFYSTPTASQLAATRALDGRGDAWVATVKPQYQAAGVAAAEVLGTDAPAGSQFLWLDVADRLDDRGLMGFLEDCLQDGVLVAPGPSFGPYPTHIRVCFTATPPDVTARGIERLAHRIGR